MVTITNEKVEKMKELRKQGLSTREIAKSTGFSLYSINKYLKGTKPDESYSTELWQQAEAEAEMILLDKGFTNIVNLNKICNAPYWDYYAEYNNKRWLIDVTINETKSIVDKFSRLVEGYSHAILHKKPEDKWAFVEIIFKEIK